MDRGEGIGGKGWVPIHQLDGAEEEATNSQVQI